MLKVKLPTHRTTGSPQNIIMVTLQGPRIGARPILLDPEHLASPPGAEGEKCEQKMIQIPVSDISTGDVDVITINYVPRTPRPSSLEPKAEPLDQEEAVVDIEDWIALADTSIYEPSEE